MVQQECDRLGVAVLWVESVCTKGNVVDNTISDIKAKLPEYAGFPPHVEAMISYGLSGCELSVTWIFFYWLRSL